jgi:hypothetical protein
MANVTVPMWIDSIKRFKDFNMTRLSYFSAEVDEPMEELSVDFKELDVSFITYGLTAAICQPTRSKSRFESVDDIEEMFDRLEGSGDFSIETPDLWLPNHLFDPKHSPERGDVYRVGQRLYKAALRFSIGHTNEEEFIEECKKAKDIISYSDEETKVFAKWNEMQVDQSIANYKQKEKLGLFLEYKEDESSKKKGRR